MEQISNTAIEEKALEIRRLIVRMVHAAACGHPGGPLGLADIFASLYCDPALFRHKPANPSWPERDRLILSNGHVCAVRYAAMAVSGYFKPEETLKFRKLGSVFQGHPSTRYLPAVENSGGSLGQGLSQAVGVALGARVQKAKYNVFACISDGECGEGMTWEAATAAAHHRAPVIAFMDYNGIQIDGFTKDVCDLGDLEAKFASFGWKAETRDGHNVQEIRAALKGAKDRLLENPDIGPQIVLFRTILGKGVSYMENKPGWHGKAPNNDEFKTAMKDLGVAV